MKIHGLAPRNTPKHSLFRTWCEMRYRCENPSKDNFKYYGGRGIKVCERWQSFPNFLEDMGDKPLGSTLDRIDANGNYEPNNCRWTTKIQQANNARSNRKLSLYGQTMGICEAARKYGAKAGTIWKRLELGWSDEDAVFRLVNRGVKYDKSHR